MFIDSFNMSRFLINEIFSIEYSAFGLILSNVTCIMIKYENTTQVVLNI